MWSQPVHLARSLLMSATGLELLMTETRAGPEADWVRLEPASSNSDLSSAILSKVTSLTSLWPCVYPGQIRSAGLLSALVAPRCLSSSGLKSNINRNCNKWLVDWKPWWLSCLSFSFALFLFVFSGLFSSLSCFIILSFFAFSSLRLLISALRLRIRFSSLAWSR